MKHILFSLAFIATQVWADFSASVNSTKVAEGDVFQLTLSTNENTAARPNWSVLSNDFEILGTSQSSNVQYINGNMSMTKSWILSLSPKKQGKLTIPAIALGQQKSQAIEIEVVDASQVPTLNSQDVSVTAEVSGDTHYVFQKIPLTVTIESTMPFYQAELRPPQLDGVELTQISDDKQSQIVRNGRRIMRIEREYTISTQKPNKIEITPFILRGNFADPQSVNRGFPSMFDRPGKPFLAKSQPITLDIQASPNRSSDWFLPANSVELHAKWSPDNPIFKVGEPVTRQISLLALGAQPEQLPKLEIPLIEGLKIYVDSDKTDKVDSNDGMVARRMVTLSIVPEHGGEFTLPELSVEWLNTDTTQEETATLPSETITVVGAVPAKAKNNAQKPVEQQPNQEQKTEQRNKQETSEKPASWWSKTWFTLLIGLLSGGGLVYVWQKFGRRENPESVRLKGIERDIQSALDAKNAKRLYAALLEWKNTGVIFSSTFAEQYRHVEQAAYQSGKVNFDALRQAVKAEWSSKKTKQGRSKATLPSLYSH